MAPSWLPSRSLLPRADSLTASQGLALDSIERVVSMMSLLGCIALITSFLTIKNLRTRSFNRLLFLAACGNILSNVATFIGHTGIKGGDRSGLCKFQATLIQWSVFAMHDKGCIDRDQVHACRWTLGLLHGSQCLPYVRRFEKWYCVLCFGVSGIPALTYLLLDTVGGRDFYGDAVVCDPDTSVFKPLTPPALVLDLREARYPPPLHLLYPRVESPSSLRARAA
jgi:hypothetical protein